MTNPNSSKYSVETNNFSKRSPLEATKIKAPINQDSWNAPNLESPSLSTKNLASLESSFGLSHLIYLTSLAKSGILLGSLYKDLFSQGKSLSMYS